MSEYSISAHARVLPPLLLALSVVSVGTDASESLLSSPNFVVRYDTVDAALAWEVTDLAERSLIQVTSQLGHVIESKIVIVLASSEESFLGNVRGETPEWGMAFAFTKEGKIVLKSPRLVRKNIDMDAVVTHEVTHIVLHRALKGRVIPLWLNEGFAMYQSKEWEKGSSAVVGWAAVTDRLYTLEELESAFPWSEERARLAYAESFLAVAYIIQQFGKESLVGLIRDLSTGEDIDAAMRKRFGIGYKRFKRDWMRYTRERFSFLTFLLSPSTLWSAVIALLVVVYVRKRRERHRLMKDSVECVVCDDGDAMGDDDVKA
jgi:hypothetical protein